MHDAHFHITQELFEQLKKNGWDGICNIASEEEYNQVQEYLKDYSFHTSCGIHPWYVDQVSFDSFMPYLEKASMIGEIGLDNTWCETDIQLQKEVFEKQLQYASQTRKPVILHLKGMEKEAYPMVEKYPNTYIVHWHSTKEYIREYRDLGCFFTVGPSVGIDESVNEVVQLVSLDHLLIESDGISALEWAYDTKVVDYVSSLQRSVEEIAKIKGLDSQLVEAQLDQNFKKICTTM